MKPRAWQILEYLETTFEILRHAFDVEDKMKDVVTTEN